MTRTTGERLSQFASLLDDTGQNVVPTVGTLGELPAALLNVAVGKAVDVLGRTTTGDGYQGTFFRSATDYSAEVAVDTQQGIYIDLGDGTYGVRSFGQAVDSRPIKRAGWFGYVGDGVTDDTAALQALTADGNCEMEIPFTGTQGALVSGTITLKSNTKLKFLSGARWVQDSSMGSNPVLATAEGSGNDLTPPVTAQTNITIENPYITMNGATARAIRASAGGHDIHIWNPIIRSGDNASGQIGILSYNCFNVNVYNPSVVLGGDDAACYSCRNFKFKAGGVTAETGYSVMTNNVIRSGTLKVTGMNSWAIQLWLLNEVGDLTTGGASGDCFVVDNVALLSDDSADLNTAIDIRGPVTGVEIRAPHIEDFWKVLKTGNSGVKGTITGAKPQSCATIFEFGSSGTLFTAPDFGVFLAGGASPSTLVAGGSLGTLILTANRLASADINAVSNANMIIRNMRDNERNLTTQTTLTLQNVIDDNVIVTHTNSATALTVTLPANSPIGQEHTISKNASGGLTVNADAGDRILFGGVTNALGASISSSTAPSTIKLKKSAQGWIVQGATGTWT